MMDIKKRSNGFSLATGDFAEIAGGSVRRRPSISLISNLLRLLGGN